jgi:hypothetical protein
MDPEAPGPMAHDLATMSVECHTCGQLCIAITLATVVAVAIYFSVR